MNTILIGIIYTDVWYLSQFGEISEVFLEEKSYVPNSDRIFGYWGQAAAITR